MTLQQLKEKYTNINIFENTDENNSIIETLFELEPSTDHPEWSNALVYLNNPGSSALKHLHNKTTETYKVKKGKLKVNVNGEYIDLEEGEELTIEPGKIHWAEGEEVIFECYSEPGWTFEDHIMID